MKKLLIAVRSRALANALVHELSSHFEIYVCKPSTDASELIEELRPDALIFDLCLQRYDGRPVLHHIHKPPIIIALSDFLDDRSFCRVTAEGVNALVQFPCSARYVADQLKCLIAEAPSPEV